MDKLGKILVQRLLRMGMEADLIPAYIRNLLTLISVTGSTNSRELNSRLHGLGWDDIELDDHTLQLALAHMESRNSGLREPNHPFPSPNETQ
jgi:hypothetical protein